LLLNGYFIVAGTLYRRDSMGIAFRT